ncbi:acetate--CoA ligase family protein [Microbacterium sp. LWO12-1.2]|uniref:acetate--CoA ligase family protein n=1 Tax=Microbacterium sp. LWO12-1.2 TaxID=3135261 RepID=UPI00342C6863
MSLADLIPLITLVSPRRVVVVGASSTRTDATGNQVLRNLRNGGFTGRIDVLSRTGGTIEGIEALSDVSEAAGADLAVVTLRAGAVLPALHDLAAVGVTAGLVMSVGFTPDEIRAIKDFSRDSGMHIHGPNCMGLINVHDRTMLWADEGILADLPAGNVAIVSQSGSGAIFVARSTSGVGFSHIVSTGNEAALTTADYVRYLAEDSRTGVIALILESVYDSDGLARAVEAAREAGKPVVALKVGSSDSGRAATLAHTGAMLSNRTVIDAYMEQIGVPLLADYDELAAAIDLLARVDWQAIGAGRTAIVTLSGGQAALAADLAEQVGATLARFSPETQRRLEEVLPDMHAINPLDAWGSADADDETFRRTLQIVSEDDGVDVVLGVIDAQSSLSAIELEYEDDIVDAFTLLNAEADVPVLLASSSSMTVHPVRVPATDASIPVLRGLRNALTAVRAAARVSGQGPRLLDRPSSVPSIAIVEEIRDSLARTSGVLDRDSMRRVLGAYGISPVSSHSFGDVDEAVRWCERNGYPVVAKIDSPDITHRSDVGGVALGLQDEGQLRDAWAAILESVHRHRPDADIRGIEVQRQIPAGIEAFLGFVSDPDIGVAVGIGIGGVLVELLDDVEYAIAPLSPESAHRLLDGTRLSQLLDGFRNLHPVVDVGSVVNLLVKLSWMADDLKDTLAAGDLNPLIIEPATGAAFVVDALLVAQERSGDGVPALRQGAAADS